VASFLLLIACLAGAVLGLAANPNIAHADARVGAEVPAVPRDVPTNPPRESDSVLYPTQKIPLVFDHARHIGKTGLTCLYCHDLATTSRRSRDRLLPPPERCDACHGTSHDDLDAVGAGMDGAKNCAFCHEGYDARDGNRVARVVMKEPYVRFDHAAHWARGVPCARCHAGVDRMAVATTAALPKMRICLECHAAGRAARSACDVCHLTVEGRLQTSFPTGALMPPPWMHGLEHGPDWILRHKIVAGADSELCATCHSERECVDCHDGRVRPRKIHPNDWLGLHAMAARQNDPVCTSCHREQSFCISCHQRAGVALSSPDGNLGERGRFHPPKAVWSDLPRTPAHHAWEAERNITACVSCHTERDCVLCHATAFKGGRGGLSPHPPGFQASCRAALAKNARPCLYCHDASDPSMSPCR
jgi:hypothetical protein